MHAASFTCECRQCCCFARFHTFSQSLAHLLLVGLECAHMHCFPLFPSRCSKRTPGGGRRHTPRSGMKGTPSQFGARTSSRKATPRTGTRSRTTPRSNVRASPAARGRTRTPRRGGLAGSNRIAALKAAAGVPQAKENAQVSPVSE